jgi:hypothetical protein
MLQVEIASDSTTDSDCSLSFKLVFIFNTLDIITTEGELRETVLISTVATDTLDPAKSETNTEMRAVELRAENLLADGLEVEEVEERSTSNGQVAE